MSNIGWGQRGAKRGKQGVSDTIFKGTLSLGGHPNAGSAPGRGVPLLPRPRPALSSRACICTQVYLHLSPSFFSMEHLIPKEVSLATGSFQRVEALRWDFRPQRVDDEGTTSQDPHN